MSRERWYSIKHYKLFYINTYHRLASFLLLMFSLNLLLSLFAAHLYLKQPEPQFYSTDGVTPPDQLVALNKPNMTSNALLPINPATEPAVKMIPE